MRCVAWAAAFSLGICASASAGAQADRRPRTAPLGTRIPVPELSEAEQASLRESARILQVFAQCVVSRTQPLAAAIVAVPPLPLESAERPALFRRATPVMRNCMMRASKMTANIAVMVGAFAEQLYRHRFPSLPVLALASVPPAIDPDGITLRATLEFADCLIDRQAGAADLLMRSRVGSGDERAAFATLSSDYARCVDAGSSLRLNQVALRAALADQLYRRALAAAGGL